MSVTGCYVTVTPVVTKKRNMLCNCYAKCYALSVRALRCLASIECYVTRYAKTGQMPDKPVPGGLRLSEAEGKKEKSPCTPL